jgi:hypothetical protein
VLDMVRSMGLMLIVIFALLFATSARKLIEPTGSDVQPAVSDGQQLLEWRNLTGSPAVLPAVPSGWQINAALMRGTSKSAAELHVGWVSPQQGYVGVDQGLLPAKKVVAFAVGSGAAPSGSAPIDGATWSTWHDSRGETFYVRTEGAKTVVVDGSLPATQLQGFVASLRRSSPS